MFTIVFCLFLFLSFNACLVLGTFQLFAFNFTKICLPICFLWFHPNPLPWWELRRNTKIHKIHKIQKYKKNKIIITDKRGAKINLYGQ